MSEMFSDGKLDRRSAKDDSEIKINFSIYMNIPPTLHARPSDKYDLSYYAFLDFWCEVAQSGQVVLPIILSSLNLCAGLCSLCIRKRVS